MAGTEALQPQGAPQDQLRYCVEEESGQLWFTIGGSSVVDPDPIHCGRLDPDPNPVGQK